MKHERQIESVANFREVNKTKTLISDLGRIVDILNIDIAAEENQSGIDNRQRADYSLLARAMVARRDNLLETITALQRRIAVA